MVAHNLVRWRLGWATALSQGNISNAVAATGDALGGVVEEEIARPFLWYCPLHGRLANSSSNCPFNMYSFISLITILCHYKLQKRY